MLKKSAHVRKPADAITVVGLDPGLANLGLGAVREEGRNHLYLGSELVRTSARRTQTERLDHLYRATHEFIKEHKADALAIEGQYFHHQREVAFKVGQAVGVCLLAAGQLGVPVFEYGPKQVKQALVGSGRADKAQIGFMVRALLNLRATPESHHVADALALALTHLSTRKLESVRKNIGT